VDKTSEKEYVMPHTSGRKEMHERITSM